MSRYSVLHLVPHMEPAFIPPPEAILRMAGYVGVERLSYFTVYARPLDWRDEDNEDYPVHEECDITMEAAIGRYSAFRQEENAHYSYRMGTQYSHWPVQLYNSYESLPEPVRGDFITGAVDFEIGRVYIPTVSQEEVQVVCGFNLALSGYGNPINIPLFLEEMKRNEMLVGLLRHMRSVTGFNYDPFMSGYY